MHLCVWLILVPHSICQVQLTVMEIMSEMRARWPLFYGSKSSTNENLCNLNLKPWCVSEIFKTLTERWDQLSLNSAYRFVNTAGLLIYLYSKRACVILSFSRYSSFAVAIFGHIIYSTIIVLTPLQSSTYILDFLICVQWFCDIWSYNKYQDWFSNCQRRYSPQYC